MCHVSWVRLLEPHPAALLSPRLLLVPQEGGDPRVAEPSEQKRLAWELHEDIYPISGDLTGGPRICVKFLFDRQAGVDYKPSKFEDERIVWDGHAFIIREMCPDGSILIEHIWDACAHEFEPLDPVDNE